WDQLLLQVSRGCRWVLRGLDKPLSVGGGYAERGDDDTSGESGEEDGHRVSFLLVCLTDTSNIAHCSALRKPWGKKNPRGSPPGWCQSRPAYSVPIRSLSQCSRLLM